MSTINKFKDIGEEEIWNAENIYHLNTKISRISKLINHYEIYKKIISLPGDIVECGVFKGISLTRFLTFREILENTYSRKIYGFDVFGKFPSKKSQEDQKLLKRWLKDAGNGIDINELDYLLSKKNFLNYELVKGDVQTTIKQLIKKKPQIKISLLHLDLDTYHATKFVLDKLFKYVVKNGIILIDDYNGIHGATKATDEFLNLNKQLEIKKLGFYSQPSFIIKN